MHEKWATVFSDVTAFEYTTIINTVYVKKSNLAIVQDIHFANDEAGLDLTVYKRSKLLFQSVSLFDEIDDTVL